LGQGAGGPVGVVTCRGRMAGRQGGELSQEALLSLHPFG
jgi:hypothetical protein